MSDTKVNRRDFVKTAIGAGTAFTILKNSRSVYGTPANGHIQFGAIGVGGRGFSILNWAMKTGQEEKTPAKALAVSDVYAKRLRLAKEAVEAKDNTIKCGAYLDYREILNRDDSDAGLLATPDHWHALQVQTVTRGLEAELLDAPCDERCRTARLGSSRLAPAEGIVGDDVEIAPQFGGVYRSGGIVAHRFRRGSALLRDGRGLRRRVGAVRGGDRCDDKRYDAARHRLGVE